MPEITNAQVRALTSAELYLGEFASNMLALAYAQAEELDSNGDGTGTLVEGQRWFDTTLDVQRRWNGSMAVGRPETLPKAVGVITKYVRLAGDNASGDGSNGNPYGSIAQAIEDLPRVSSYLGMNHVVDCIEAGTFTLPDIMEIGTGAYIQIKGAVRANWTEVLAAIATTAIVVDTQEDGAGGGGTPGQHGRVVTIAGLGAAADEYIDCMIEMTSGNLSGVQGWVIENNGDDISFRLNSDAYTDDGGAGLVVGDQLKLLRPSTLLETPSNTLQVSGTLRVQEVYVNTDYVTCADKRSGFRANYSVVNTRGSTNVNVANGGAFDIKRSAMFGSVALMYGGLLTTRGDIPTVFHDFSLKVNGAGGDEGKVMLRGRVCMVDHTGGTALTIPANVQIVPRDNKDDPANAESLALYHYSGIVVSTGARTTSEGGKWIFPPLIGNVTVGIIQNANGKYVRNLDIALLYAAVYCGAVNPENSCSIDGSADSYVNEFGVEVIGTGNYKKKLATKLTGWAGDAAAGTLNGMKSWDFDSAADEYIVAMGVISPDYIPGSALFANFLWDGGADAVVAHQALMDIYLALFVPGTTDVAAPPTNRFPAAASQTGFVVSTGNADRIQLEEDFALSSAAGEINGVALAAGSPVSMSILRDADGSGGGTDDLANDMRLYADAIELYQLV